MRLAEKYLSYSLMTLFHFCSSFSTAGVLGEDNHHSSVVSIASVPFVHSSDGYVSLSYF
jgi:hypothetical protein